MRRRHKSQGGYALLMVFLMAAIIALMLYRQMPRVAFESEREKEQLLIDRGEQYTRAIQLYYLANNRQWPTSLDDLEKREKRFLRRRYVDPFTGKDEWRIIHTTGGFLTDSLVQKPVDPNANKSQSASNSSTNNTAGAEQPPEVNAAVLQRPSDRPLTPPGFDQRFEQANVVQDPSVQQPVNTPLPPITLAPQGQGLPPITLQPGAPNQPGGLPPITLAPPSSPPGANGAQLPAQAPGQFRPPQIPGQGPVAPFPGGLPGGNPNVPQGFRIDANGQLVPNAPAPGQLPGIPGQPQGLPQGIPGIPGGIPGQPFGQLSNQPSNQPGATQGSPNSAVNAINQLLTSPRQTTTSTPSAFGNNQTGAIAGIASTHKGPSIKVYKDQAKYELWEFVFTPTASTVPGAGAPGNGIPGNGQGRGPNQPGGLSQPGGMNQPGGPGLDAPSGTFGPGGGQPILAPGPGR